MNSIDLFIIINAGVLFTKLPWELGGVTGVKYVFVLDVFDQILEGVLYLNKIFNVSVYLTNLHHI